MVAMRQGTPSNRYRRQGGSDTRIGRAEVVRQSMLALIDKGDAQRRA
jgi:hypothetical protein